MESSMTNPFLSLWLSQANAWAGAMRGFWTAEMQRQQTQMMNEAARQVMQFWGGGWMLPTAGTPARRAATDRRR
jgi:hypothetical protein